MELLELFLKAELARGHEKATLCIGKESGKIEFRAGGIEYQADTMKGIENALAYNLAKWHLQNIMDKENGKD